MTDPYRTFQSIAPIPDYRSKREGTLMSKWHLNNFSLEWEHGDACSAKLGVANIPTIAVNTTRAEFACRDITLTELKELRLMIDRAISEMETPTT